MDFLCFLKRFLRIMKTGFIDFSERALKMCVEIFDKDKADLLADMK